MLCKELLLLRCSGLQRRLRLPSGLCGHFCWGMLRRRLLLLRLGPGLLPLRWRCGQEQGHARSSWGMCCPLRRSAQLRKLRHVCRRAGRPRRVEHFCCGRVRSLRLPPAWPRRRGVKPKALGRARSQKLGLDRPH